VGCRARIWAQLNSAELSKLQVKPKGHAHTEDKYALAHTTQTPWKIKKIQI